jgi:Cytochrome b5-like Heme/Steroid binding domain
MTNLNTDEKSENGDDHYDWFMLSTLLQQWVYMYGIQIIVVVTLMGIIIFRREMSCNHCYSAEQQQQQQQQHRKSNDAVEGTTNASSISSDDESRTTTATTTATSADWDDRTTALLLDEASCYGSGTFTMFLTTLRLIRRGCSVFYNTRIPFVVQHLYDTITSWWMIAVDGRRLDDILDGAENWSIMGPQPQVPSPLKRQQRLLERLRRARLLEGTVTTHSIFPASHNLPTDIMIQLLSYLHPKDVISLSLTNRTIRVAIHDETNELSKLIWKTLWYRDYGWMIGNSNNNNNNNNQQDAIDVNVNVNTNAIWSVVQDAIQQSLRLRSNCTTLDDIHFTSTFYFRFGMSFVNYIIAGHCHRNLCLIGLGGHVYDITNFIDIHPGSSETLLVHSGRDASMMFETMRHTVSARNQAGPMCLIVDATLLNGTGAQPTLHLLSDDVTTTQQQQRHQQQQQHSRRFESRSISPVPSPVVSQRCYTNRKLPSTLECMYYKYLDEQELYQQQACHHRIRSQWDVTANVSSTTGTNISVVGEIHAYYDPIAERWRAWYMNAQFESVFVDF